MISKRSEVVLHVENVYRSFPEGDHLLEVLHDVTLDVFRGELTLLMGPSGSGKTTLLSIMGMLLKPTSGRVVLLDKDMTELSENALPMIRRKHIAFIFQSFNLLSALNGVENVEVMLGLQGIKGRRARKEAMELLEHVGLADRWHHLPEELSGGEKQRVAVARALASPAELILGDEPSGNLDSKTSDQVIGTLQRLAHEDNRAVLVVTHDDSLCPLADRVIRLKDGHVASDSFTSTPDPAKLSG